MAKLDRGERTAVAGLGLLLAVTAGWWALALWPAPPDVAWLHRTREVCFGRTETGLPDAGGWILLLGQPLGMLGILLAAWRDALGRGLGALARTPGGRGMLSAGGVLLLVGALAAGGRVRSATAAAAWTLPDPDGPLPASYPTLDRPAPPDLLVDQHGERVGIEAFRGRPVLVTFAFGHCETVCPVVVHRVVEARSWLRDMDPGIMVVTLDPWRDAPSRLGHVAEQWKLPPGARFLGGEVAEVEAALDAWNVARSRDERTGDVVHPTVVYLVDREGMIRYATMGGVDAIVDLARRMVP